MAFGVVFWQAIKSRIRSQYESPLGPSDVLPPTDGALGARVVYATVNTGTAPLYVNLARHVDEQEGSIGWRSWVRTRFGTRMLRYMLPFSEDDGASVPRNSDHELFWGQALEAGCDLVSMNGHGEAWQDTESDDTLVMLVTHGLGAPLLRHIAARNSGEPEDGVVGAHFSLDLQFLESTAHVRDGWAAYGARLRLTMVSLAGENTPRLLPLDITWSSGARRSVPGDSDWADAKMRFRCALMMWVTLNYHLVRTHLIVSSTLSIAAPSALPASHPVRRFLAPFHLRTARINTEAMLLLLPKRGVFHRMSGVSERGRASAIATAVDMFTFSTLSDDMRLRDMHPKDHPEWRGDDVSPFPYQEDALLVWRAFMTLAREYLSLHYDTDVAVREDKYVQAFLARCNGLMPATTIMTTTRDHLACVLAYFMFNVTVAHEMHGSVLPYVQRPALCPMALREGVSGELKLASKDHVLLTQRLALYVTPPMPKLNADYSQLATTDGERAFWRQRWSHVWDSVQKEVDERNMHRAVPFVGCSPRELEISVSV